MRIILMRHCETDWNRIGKVQGSSDRGLSEDGKEHSLRISAGGDWSALSAIHASDLRRAAQTAAPIMSASGVHVRLDPRFRECDFGELEGSRYEAFLAAVPVDGGGSRRILPLTYVPFGGESSADVLVRGLAALREIVAAHGPDDRALVVTHGRMIRILVEALTGLTLRHLANGECVELSFADRASVHLHVERLRTYPGDGSGSAETLYESD